MTGFSGGLSHPAFVGFSEVIPLSGFSGASVAVLRTPQGSRFVRKAARDTATNLALRRQARRQQWLRTAIEGGANVPEVATQGRSKTFTILTCLSYPRAMR